MVQREVADRFFAVAWHEGLRRGLGARCSSSPSEPASTPSRARSSGRGRTSTRRSSPSERTAPGVPDGVKRVVEGAFAHRRKTLAELARARRRRVTRAKRPPRSRRSAAIPPRAPRRSTPPEFVALARGAAVNTAPAPAKINLALVVGAARTPTATTRWRPCSSGSTSATRSRSSLRESLAVDGFAGDTIVRSALEASPPRPASSRAGTLGSRSGSRSRPGSAAAAPTPRRRSGSRTTLLDEPLAPAELHAIARGLGADVPFFLDAGPEARHRRRLDARSRSTCRRTSSCCCCSRRRGEGVDRRRLRAASTSAPALAATAGARARGHRAGATAPRDLAALPPNDLASSPLAAELLAAGAFRADVSGAGPTVYGLFARPRRSRARGRRARPPRARPGSPILPGTVALMATTRRQSGEPAASSQERRFRLALWIAVVEGMLVIANVIPEWAVFIVAIVAVGYWASWTRRPVDHGAAGELDLRCVAGLRARHPLLFIFFKTFARRSRDSPIAALRARGDLECAGRCARSRRCAHGACSPDLDERIVDLPGRLHRSSALRRVAPILGPQWGVAKR